MHPYYGQKQPWNQQKTTQGYQQQQQQNQANKGWIQRQSGNNTNQNLSSAHQNFQPSSAENGDYLPDLNHRPVSNAHTNTGQYSKRCTEKQSQGCAPPVTMIGPRNMPSDVHVEPGQDSQCHIWEKVGAGYNNISSALGSANATKQRNIHVKPEEQHSQGIWDVHVDFDFADDFEDKTSSLDNQKAENSNITPTHSGRKFIFKHVRTTPGTIPNKRALKTVAPETTPKRQYVPLTLKATPPLRPKTDFQAASRHPNWTKMPEISPGRDIYDPETGKKEVRFVEIENTLSDSEMAEIDIEENSPKSSGYSTLRKPNKPEDRAYTNGFAINPNQNQTVQSSTLSDSEMAEIEIEQIPRTSSSGCRNVPNKEISRSHKTGLINPNVNQTVHPNCSLSGRKSYQVTRNADAHEKYMVEKLNPDEFSDSDFEIAGVDIENIAFSQPVGEKAAFKSHKYGQSIGEKVSIKNSHQQVGEDGAFQPHNYGKSRGEKMSFSVSKLSNPVAEVVGNGPMKQKGHFFRQTDEELPHKPQRNEEQYPPSTLRNDSSVRKHFTQVYNLQRQEKHNTVYEDSCRQYSSKKASVRIGEDGRKEYTEVEGWDKGDLVCEDSNRRKMRTIQPEDGSENSSRQTMLTEDELESQMMCLNEDEENMESHDLPKSSGFSISNLFSANSIQEANDVHTNIFDGIF